MTHSSFLGNHSLASVLQSDSLLHTALPTDYMFVDIPEAEVVKMLTSPQCQTLHNVLVNSAVENLTLSALHVSTTSVTTNDDTKH